MAKFVFNLQALLRQRTYIERDRQRALAEKQAVVNELTEGLRQMTKAIGDSMTEMRTNHLVGRLDLSLLAAHRRYVGHMRARAMEQTQRIALATTARDQARLALAEAAKGRKMIEKLREKAFEAWRAGIARKELQQSDEVGMQLAYETSTELSNEASVEAQEASSAESSTGSGV